MIKVKLSLYQLPNKFILNIHSTKINIGRDGGWLNQSLRFIKVAKYHLFGVDYTHENKVYPRKYDGKSLIIVKLSRHEFHRNNYNSTEWS